jgi:hypothetical protein
MSVPRRLTPRNCFHGHICISLARVRGRLFPVAEDWYEWHQIPPLADVVQVRIAVGDGGRLVLCGLRIDGSPTADLLRAIPVGRIEAVANAQLAVVDTEIVVSDVPRSIRERPTMPPVGSPDGWEASDPSLAVRLPADRSDGRSRGRPDLFYRQVADAYLDLSQGSPRPASDIARTHGVPVTTAHRWVKEARRRGFLPPGRPGKTG